VKYRVSLFLMFMYDFAVQFFDFSPEDLEHVQFSFPFNVKSNCLNFSTFIACVSCWRY
jgi:hypothetical protein